MRPIDNINQLNSLVNNTYVYAVIAGSIGLVIAFFIARLILFKGTRNDSSHITRRVWYFIIGIGIIFSFYLYNSLIVSENITKAPLQQKFSNANLIGVLIIIGIYVILGMFTMFIYRTSKWGSILGKTK
jgi:quinol-cytochrome oxidoreductase complex cytochrome b subunit